MPSNSRVGKRSARQATPQEKLAAIERVDNGESKASVARDIGYPESTLRGWCKNKEKIHLECRKSLSPQNVTITEPRIKRPRVDDNSNSIPQPFNLSVKSPQTLSPAISNNNGEHEVDCASPRSLANTKLDNGRSSPGRDLTNRSLESIAKDILFNRQQNPDHYTATQNKRSALKIKVPNNNLPLSSYTQASSLLTTTSPHTKQASPRSSKENLKPYSGIINALFQQQNQRANYDLLPPANFNQGNSYESYLNLFGSLTASGSPNNIKPELNSQLCKDYEQHLLRYYALILQQNPFLNPAPGNNLPLLYQQLTKPVHQSPRPMEKGKIPIDESRVTVEDSRVTVEESRVTVDESRVTVEESGVAINEPVTAIEKPVMPVKPTLPPNEQSSPEDLSLNFHRTSFQSPPSVSSISPRDPNYYPINPKSHTRSANISPRTDNSSPRSINISPRSENASLSSATSTSNLSIPSPIAMTSRTSSGQSNPELSNMHYTGTNNSISVVSQSMPVNQFSPKVDRKILKRKFEVNSLLPINQYNKPRISNDSGFSTSEDEDELRNVVEGGEKLVHFLEQGKEKSVTHVQLGLIRNIVNRLKMLSEKH